MSGLGPKHGPCQLVAGWRVFPMVGLVSSPPSLHPGLPSTPDVPRRSPEAAQPSTGGPGVRHSPTVDPLEICVKLVAWAVRPGACTCRPAAHHHTASFYLAGTRAGPAGPTTLRC